MRAFVIVWLGQLVSLTGANMTRFAISIWAWQETGLATTLALVGLASFAPAVLLSPLAGALVDRWPRKPVMMASDAAAGLATLAMLLLYHGDGLQIWHLYALGAWSGAFSAFQFPAYSAAISTMLPSKEYARASGMLALAGSASDIAAPLLAGLMLALVGIDGVFVIDLLTVAVALATLAWVAIPNPQGSSDGAAAGSGLGAAMLYGFRYIVARRPLLHLQATFLGINLVATLGSVMVAPMVLARTGGNELMLASVTSAMGVGGVAGGALLSVWGGPKRRIHALLLGMLASGLLGQSLMGLSSTLPGWMAAGFLMAFFVPILNGASQAIWQSKVAPDVQGRVFAARRFLAQITSPLALAVAGPLADRVMEPAMAPGGALVPLFGPLIGSGPGAGMALLLVFAGVAAALIALSGYARRELREVETLIPDHA